METKTVSRTDRLRAAHEKLQAAVAQIVSGDDWKQVLKVISKFHKYSFNNHLMISLQRPDATIVAGFNKWRSLLHLKYGGFVALYTFGAWVHGRAAAVTWWSSRRVQSRS